MSITKKRQTHRYREQTSYRKREERGGRDIIRVREDMISNHGLTFTYLVGKTRRYPDFFYL